MKVLLGNSSIRDIGKWIPAIYEKNRNLMYESTIKLLGIVWDAEENVCNFLVEQNLGMTGHAQDWYD